MTKYSRSIVIAVLVILLAPVPQYARAVTETVGNLENPESPSYYWPGPEGTRLVRKSTKWHNGEIVQQGESEMICGSDATFRGLPTKRERLIFRTREVGGQEKVSELTFLQAVNDSVSCTLGMQFDDGSVRFEEVPYIDLLAPLTPGAGWSSVVEYFSFDPDVQPPFDWEVTAEVVESGLTIEVPAGTFTRCLLVRETGHSVSAIQLESGVNVGRSVRLESVIERWWYSGTGCIREYDTMRTVAADDPSEVLAEFRYESELFSIERP